MFQHTLIQSVQAPSGQLNAGNKVYQGAASLEIDETIPVSSADMLVNFTAIVANIKSLVISSTNDVSIETNSSSSPGNTLALKANVPYIWNTDSYDALVLTVDVTKLYFTNASGVNVATVSIRMISDPTP